MFSLRGISICNKHVSVVGIIIVAIGSVLSLWAIITMKASFVRICDDLDSKSDRFK